MSDCHENRHANIIGHDKHICLHNEPCKITRYTIKLMLMWGRGEKEKEPRFGLEAANRFEWGLQTDFEWRPSISVCEKNQIKEAYLRIKKCDEQPATPVNSVNLGEWNCFQHLFFGKFSFTIFLCEFCFKSCQKSPLKQSTSFDRLRIDEEEFYQYQ